MTTARPLVPSTLQSRGFIAFDDPDAHECFEAFSDWSQAVAVGSSQDSQLLAAVRDFYQDLFQMRMEPPVGAPLPSNGESIYAWIDPAKYVFTDALLDGFFSGRYWIGEMAETAMSRRRAWNELALAMVAVGGSYDSSQAESKIFAEGIEAQRLPDGRFAHTQGLGGRHRTVGMLALTAPAIPVRLFLPDLES